MECRSCVNKVSESRIIRQRKKVETMNGPYLAMRPMTHMIKASIFVALAAVPLTIPRISIAQSPPTAPAPAANTQAPPTEREKALQEEIQKLEGRIESLEKQNPAAAGQRLQAPTCRNRQR